MDYRISDIAGSLAPMILADFSAKKLDGYRFGFNGMERDDQLKGVGNSYDFGARIYDSRLGRWLTVDPLASVYPNLSVFQFAANSPIQFLDPDGKKIVPFGEKEADLYNTYRRTINAKLDALDIQISTLEKRKDEGMRINKRTLHDLNEMKDAYLNVNFELDAIEVDNDVFVIRYGDNISNSAGGGNISFNSETGLVDVNISSRGDYSDVQKIAHELTHIYQFKMGEMDLSRDGKGGLAYDKTDEYAAFGRQNLFSDVGVGAIHEDDVIERVNKSDAYKNLSINPKSIYDSSYPLARLHDEQFAGGRYGKHAFFLTTGYQARERAAAEYQEQLEAMDELMDIEIDDSDE